MPIALFCKIFLQMNLFNNLGNNVNDNNFHFKESRDRRSVLITKTFWQQARFDTLKRNKVKGNSFSFIISLKQIEVSVLKVKILPKKQCEIQSTTLISLFKGAYQYF